MSCTHPRIMAVCDISKLSWPVIKHMEQLNWKINYDRKRAYRLVAKDSRDHPLEDIPSWALLEDMEIPCGHCIQCRLDYSKTWAIRCCHEAQFYEHNYFITLTLDDDHIIRGSTGNPTLDKDALSIFMKKLRQKFDRKYGHKGIKFFGCGEYGQGDGSRGLNPHYHLIIFNLPLDDITRDIPTSDGCIVHKTSKTGEILYFSKTIQDCWLDEDGHPKGFISVQDANYNTEAYVSRYILKKQGAAETLVFSKNLSVVPPFLRMSNRPAIGMAYFEDNESYLIDNPSLIIPRDGKKPLVAGVPRYYKKKIQDRHPELYDSMLKKAKSNIVKSRSLIWGKINEQRANQEDHIIKSFNAFERNL